MLSSITAKAKATWQKKQTKKPSLKSKKVKNNASKSTGLASEQTSSLSPQKKRKANSSKRALNSNSKSNAPSLKKRKLNESSLQPRRKPAPHQTVDKTVRNYQQRIAFSLPLSKQKQRSVIKPSAMPEGLEEDELKTFFYQFGHVTRFCLKRHRYGRSLAYAYVEFGDPDIAKIVVDTLNCVLLYGTMLEVKEIAPEDVKASFWRTHTMADAKCFTKMDRERDRWQNHATIANLEYQFSEWHDKLLKDEKALNAHLKKLGIQYEFNGIQEEMNKQSQTDGTSTPNIDEAKNAETFLSEDEQNGDEL